MTDISTLWATLDPSVQQWLLQNPGTMMLPRTYVNLVEVGAGHVLHLDDHGGYWLSSDEMLFLKGMRHDRPDPRTSPSPQLIPAASTSRARSERPASDPRENSLDR